MPSSKKVAAVGPQPAELRSLLSIHCPNLCLTSSVETALEEQAEVYILSLELEELDVWQCLRLFSSLEPKPRILVSAGTPGDWMSEAFRSGVDGILTEPFRATHLLGALERNPDWDPQNLDQLRSMMGLEQTRAIVSSFLSDLDNRGNSLREAVRSAHSERCYQLSHSLKTSAGNVGGTIVVALCAEIEASSKQASVPIELGEKLFLACRALKDILEDY